VPRLVGMSSGKVLEIGPGSGNQLPRFDTTAISHIYGVEPNEQLFKRIRDDLIDKYALGNIYVPINAVFENVEALKSFGIQAGSLDTVVCMQVLCSVEDINVAIRRIHQLLKPGGQLLFWEHQASEDMLTRFAQSE
jgi:SAM-dependent methyltransferase